MLSFIGRTTTRWPAHEAAATSQNNDTARADLASTNAIIEAGTGGRKARLRAGELLLIGGVSLLAAVAWLHPEEVPLATRTSLVTVGLLFAIAALALGDETQGWRYWVRELLPVPVVPYIYLNLGRLIPLVNGNLYDAQLEAWDRALLGAETQAALYAVPLPPWLADLLTLAYSTFFFNPIVMLVALAARRDPVLRRITSTVILTFLVSYAGYFLVPAYGPRTTVARERYTTLPQGVVGETVRDLLDNWEKTKTDAFPSGHTMVTLSVLYCLRQRLRRLYNVMLPAGALLIAATVLLTYHYVVDVLVAVPLTAFCLLAARLLVGPIAKQASA